MTFLDFILQLIASPFLALLTLEAWANANRPLVAVIACFNAPIILALLVLLRAERQRQISRRPDWGRMMADTRYFEQSVWRIFRARGYEVLWAKSLPDPIERQPRDVVFALTLRGELVAALCGRWVIPITSEVITRFEQALATTDARRGMILTTSYFTDAAKAAAVGQHVELHDGDELADWIAAIWA